MTVFTFHITLILAYIQWVKAQELYQDSIPNYKNVQFNRGRHNSILMRSATSSSTEIPTLFSKEAIQNINKNVNVVLNVDPEEVAQRLWKIIQENLNQKANPDSRTLTKQQLKRAITPLVSSTRRGFTEVPIVEIGDHLEKITRRCLTMDDPDRPLVDREIMTKDIVAEMMSTLKDVVTPDKKQLPEDAPSRRMIEIPENSTEESESDDRYATLEVKVQRRDIKKIINSML